MLEVHHVRKRDVFECVSYYTLKMNIYIQQNDLQKRRNHAMHNLQRF